MRQLKTSLLERKRWARRMLSDEPHPVRAIKCGLSMR